ncbi:putative small heat shock protein HSP20 [Rosa chinensis]|uniref:Putative small heat shock protein HSP20 n=1 Tax=Rosa chinensis TaxID=74649 RepID=A0A2P6RD97_ROSCH|nr:putative small heat shock protein HSP20 [Rosa chinensis]PRQ44419.1 putative small heat shock protein HSP20 [Rosa chinensis]
MPQCQYQPPNPIHDPWPFCSILSQSETASFTHAHIDWKETPTAHVSKADVPGLRKDEVKVEVEDDKILQVIGERKHDVEEKTETWHQVEHSRHESSTSRCPRRRPRRSMSGQLRSLVNQAYL